MTQYTVAALYKFAPLPDFKDLRAPLLARCQELEICGTLLLAHEGINGTIAASAQAIEAILGYLRQDPRLHDLEYKLSTALDAPFKRMKVKLKKEIVTLGVPSVDPNISVGQYIEPDGWNAIISDPTVVVLDTRNDYEVEMGTFARAVNPHIVHFRDFSEFVAHASELAEKPKVAMFCTGGIRCEKASSLMLNMGFETVYHLKGGILKYLETVPEDKSLWQGECFVFDERIALGHGLKEHRELVTEHHGKAEGE